VNERPRSVSVSPTAALIGLTEVTTGDLAFFFLDA
jgi:hypothetical protein